MVKTILLVDSDTAFVDQVNKKLLASGYRVLTARNQVEAERIMETSVPDLMVTEVMLERMDAGFGLAWKVKKAHPEMPVIIASAVTWKTGLDFGIDTAEQRSWINCDYFLNKPIRPEQLESVINQCLPTGEKRAAH